MGNLNKGRAGCDISRYYGKNGKPTKEFIDFVCSFQVVNGDKDIARKICEKGEIRQFVEGQKISEQDGDDDVAFFIISGDVEVHVNGSVVAKRRSKELVGEMSVMEFGTRRCATLLAKNKVDLLCLGRDDIQKLVEDYPAMLKRMFNVLAERLRERNVNYRIPNTPPKVFVGSSTKGKDFAHLFVDKVKEFIETKAKPVSVSSEDIDNTPVSGVTSIAINYWDKAVFSPSGDTLGTLIRQTKEVDFAIFALSKDDLTVKHASSKWLPRDNVIFEIGLFMGAISKERTYLVMEKSDFKSLKLPTDLQGFTIAVYDRKATGSFEEKAEEIAKLIQRHGSISGVLK